MKTPSLLFLSLIVCWVFGAVGGPAVNQYFPLNPGDNRYYQDHTTPGYKATELITQGNYNGRSVYSLNFHDEWDLYPFAKDTWYLGLNNGALALYGIHSSWGSMAFNGPANLVTDQTITNNQTLTSHVTGTYGGNTMNVTIQSTVSSAGTVTVPAGTFYNCKQLLVVETATLAGVAFNNYDSAAWILAPGVGIIKDGVAIWDTSINAFNFNDLFGKPQDYLEMLSGTINNIPIDFTPPSNTLSDFPQNGSQIYVNPVFISGTASDAGLGDSGIAQVTVNGTVAANGSSTGNYSAVWSESVTLAAGTNTLKIVAFDRAGNKTTNLLSLIEMLPAPVLTAQPASQTVAPGAMVAFNVSTASSLLPPSYQWRKNGTNIIGATNSAYVISSVLVSQAGYYSVVVANASGMTASSNALLTVDSQVPTITIVNPTPGLQVSNSLFNVTGKASDNSKVDSVFYNLNKSGWLAASTTNNGSNWTAQVILNVGTNLLQAYAVDIAGNRSATNSVNFVYVLSAPLTVRIVGGGSLSPNYAGANLQIGKNYSITATPAAGFTFANWTGLESVILTNRPTLTFTMASNLNFTANFVDVTKPTLSILTPAPNLQVSNAQYTVTGRAGDNVGIASVFYSLNQGFWLPASTGNIWSNWTAQVSLKVGTNILQAYAIDFAGNRSATNLVSMVYVLTAPLTVQVSGNGTLSPNYNGARLQIGKNYSMIATPAIGFAFTNWTGLDSAVLTNKPTLTFNMASNLSFTANFVDVTKPTVTILTPAPSLQVSNVQYTVTGRAGDNVGIAGVYFSLNLGGWLAATTANNGSNWSAQVSLAVGTNSLRAYSVDTAGNQSATNTVSFVYVLAAPLSVQIQGNGTLSPNYNGTFLQIGKNYSMTATPAAGSAFTNWTGAGSQVLTNGRTLTFTMASNRLFTANFLDVAPPTVTILSPTPNQMTTIGNEFFIHGTASDNVSVASVFYQLNGGGWLAAYGTTNWQASGFLNPGTNILRAYAIDSSGIPSSTNTVNFVYVLKSLLSVTTSGNGTITPNYNGVSLQIGQNYTMTAAPGIGFVFTNWSQLYSPTVAGASVVPLEIGTIPTQVPGFVLTNRPTLLFSMAQNLRLQANFLDMAPPTVTITSPTANQRVSNYVYLVTGRAADNGAVAAVYYQLNYSGWFEASYADGSQQTNWFINDLKLANNATNTLQVYAVDTSGNVSATNTVKFVNLQVDSAPDSLAGYLASVSPFNGSSFTVGFGSGTYSQFSDDTNNPPFVGNYSYTKSDASSGVIVVSNSLPPSGDGGTSTINFNFSSPGVASFYNLDSGDSGTIVFTQATNVAPASLAGRKAFFIKNDGNVLSAVFGGGTVNTTNTSGETGSGTYGYQACGPQAGLITVGSPDQGTNYIILNFFATNNGVYYNTSFDALGNFGNYESSVFVLPSAVPVAPASLAGMVGRLTHGDGSVSTLGFGAATFSETSVDTNNDFSVGSYHYNKLNSTNAQITITPTAPPASTNHSGSAVLTFVAPNFCYFTNNDSGPLGINTVSLTPAANLVPTSLAGKTIYATNSSGTVEVITYTSNTAFTQTELYSDNPGTSHGTYTFTGFSPIGAMLKLRYTSPSDQAGAIAYVQVAFSQTGQGTFYVTFYDNAGDAPNIDVGTFSLH